MLTLSFNWPENTRENTEYGRQYPQLETEILEGQIMSKVQMTCN
jgi:hypothetical protein